MLLSSGARGAPATPPTTTASVAAEPIPIGELFRPRGYTSVRLSPDGARLAALHTDAEDIQHLVILDLTTRQLDTLRGDGRRDIYDFRWLDNRRIVYQDGVHKRFANGMFIVDVTRLGMQRPINAYDSAAIIGLPRARPNHVLAWIRGSANSSAESGNVIELNALKPLPKQPVGVGTSPNTVRLYLPPIRDGEVTGWATDEDGELALCSMYIGDKTRLFRYAPAGRDWNELKLDWDEFDLVDLDPDGRRIWVVDHTAATGFRLRAHDPVAGTFEEPIHTEAAYDLARSSAHFSRRTRQLAGLVYEQRRGHRVWFDERFAAVQATVDAALPPESDNMLRHTDDAERRWLFASTGPVIPGDYYLFDTEAKTLTHVFQGAEWLEGKDFQPARPIAFKARDGLRLEGYLTLPPGASKESPAPLVVLVHGGPWVRDTWSFNPEVQFLVSRGYAVLQPNYRGSSGYTPEVSHHADYEFRLMHDDVTDATRAMLRTGLVDPKRVAIMGASFGGFLAAGGVAFEPDLYRCAVSTCGIFDWEQLIRSKRFEGRPAEYRRLRARLGSAGKDEERFHAISPLAHAAVIRVPVLVAHGKDDTIVDVAQSRKFVAALKQHGVPHETFFRALEGHGFYNYDNRVAFYTQVDAFLARHLAPTAAPAASAVVAAAP